MAGAFLRLNDEEHLPFPLYENYIRTDAIKISDPDLEALGADSGSVIVKKQSIEQYSTAAGPMVGGRNAATM